MAGYVPAEYNPNQYGAAALGRRRGGVVGLATSAIAALRAGFQYMANSVSENYAKVAQGVLIGGAGAISAVNIARLLDWSSTPEATEVLPEETRREIQFAVNELGYSGAVGGTSASIIGEQFWDTPQINYEGLPQTTYTVRAHRGLIGVGSGAMEHKTGGSISFTSSTARKSMAVRPYGTDLNLEKQFARTTTPNVRATAG